ncbi:MAG: phosphate acyltransferase PlsX [Coriobacteriia bacterium]|nr:phosphate acyltransferase PlsX [Coriobacteriia bacterium]
MSQVCPVTVVVDAMGGDRAPSEILSGVELALASDPEIRIVLTGSDEVITPFAERHSDKVVAVPTTEVIAMDEHPASAVRSKKDSSIVVGCRLVADEHADAFFSAGSTGAAMAAATLVMGRIRGVRRPAIATVIPTVGIPCVLLDVGANADCKPEDLVQFAGMGAVYASVVLSVPAPRVALLNIGEESTKGSQLAQEAHVLMSEHVAGFVGNVEGRDLMNGACDVIVTDGFTGNVALKLLEGTSKVLLGEIKKAMTSTPILSLAAAVLKPALSDMKHRLDPDVYGGAPLLGVKGVCIIGHGSSNATAVANAIRVAAQAVRGGLTERVAEKIAKLD